MADQESTYSMLLDLFHVNSPLEVGNNSRIFYAIRYKDQVMALDIRQRR